MGSDATLFGYDSGAACLSFLALTSGTSGVLTRPATDRGGDGAGTVSSALRPAWPKPCFFTAWVHQLRGDTADGKNSNRRLIALSEDQGIPCTWRRDGCSGPDLAEEGRADEGGFDAGRIAGQSRDRNRSSGSVWRAGGRAEGLLRAGAVQEALQVVTMRWLRGADRGTVSTRRSLAAPAERSARAAPGRRSRSGAAAGPGVGAA